MRTVPALTAERLREVLAYDPETGVFTWLIQTAARVKIGSVAGGRNEQGYIRIRVDGKRYKGHRLAWLYMTGEWPDLDVDHRDGVFDNNRWANLRQATNAQNRANSKINKNSTTGIKGVREYGRDRWIAGIRAEGKNHHLGIFKCAEEARAAYENAAVRFFGEFARAA